MASLFRFVRYHPRLMLGAALGVVVAFIPLPGIPSFSLTRGLIGWNAGALFYLFAVGLLFARTSIAQIHYRALRQDDGRYVLLVMVILAAIACLVAIVAQLADAKDLHGAVHLSHILLTMLTILTSWSFTQTMFALHYAHEFYLARSRNQPGGLIFPDTSEPGYSDFLYFSCILGTSAQTADVNISGRAMRKVVLLHCLLAFFFNTSVLALTINIASSLI